MKARLFGLLIIASLQGCTTYVAHDYDQYLQNNEGNTTFPTTTIEAQYTITEGSLAQKYNIKSVMAGAANTWVVEPGKILRKTLESDDVQRAFQRLKYRPRPLTGPEPMKIVYDVLSYQFADFKAMIALRVEASHGGETVLNETYRSEGISQGGKMFWGGAFAMKNAIHQSTKAAFDEVVLGSLNDLEAALHQDSE